MKRTLLLGILTLTNLCAEEPKTESVSVKASHGYANLGLMALPFPNPMIGLGYRYQNNHHGFDGAINMIVPSPFYYPIFFEIKESISYLYYFKPNLDSFYMGGGVSCTESFIGNGVYFSPEFILGKQYTTNSGKLRFFQVQIDAPRVHLDNRHQRKSSFPFVTFSYGFCF